MDTLVLDIDDITATVELLTKTYLLDYHRRGAGDVMINEVAAIYKEDIRPRSLDLMEYMAADITSSRSTYQARTHLMERELLTRRRLAFNYVSDEEQRADLCILYAKCIIAPWTEVMVDIEHRMAARFKQPPEWRIYTYQTFSKAGHIVISDEGDYRQAILNKLIEEGRINVSEELKKACRGNTRSISMILPTNM